jgi:cytochrome c oxidase subunit 3
MSEATESAAFERPEAELAVDRLGMWTFLASEALLFGGLLLAYAIARLQHHVGFSAGSHELSFWLGTINTGVLLTSSFTMALADARAETKEWAGARRFMLATIALGLVFIAIKLVEYHEEFAKGLAPLFGVFISRTTPDGAGIVLFIDLYFAMTGIHAAHLLGGVLVIVYVALRWTRTAPESRLRRITALGLYWHFVDVIWVFLYPLLYLVGR